MRILITLITLFSIASCEKNELPKDLPECIQESIKEEINNNTCLKSVDEYSYNGQFAYRFDYPCPEGRIAIFDEECHLFCESGGFIITSQECSTFNSNAVLVRNIWNQ